MYRRKHLVAFGLAFVGTYLVLHGFISTKAKTRKTFPVQAVEQRNSRQVALNFNLEEKNILPVSSSDVSDKTTIFVVVLAYPRTGSTLTGELFQRNPDAFYVYEPFYPLRSLFPFPRLLTPDPKLDSLTIETWKCYFACNLTCFFKNTQRKLHVLTKFYLSDANEPCKYVDDVSHKDCVQKLENICHSKSIRVIKTLRATMEEAELFIKDVDPDYFRAIHLTRDPRASFQSRRSVHRVHDNETEDYNRKLCALMHQDATVGHKLSRTYPQSFFELHYEELAHNPTTVVDSVYNFVTGQDAPAVVKKWLIDNTQAAGAVEKRFQTTRRNASETAEAWKKKLPVRLKRSIDGVCRDFYAVSGLYTPLDD